MNEHKQIDWSQVIPGKTWLESPNGCQCRVDAIVEEDVWVYYMDGKNYPAHHLSWTKSSIAACKWKIREEWENITKECTFGWMNVGIVDVLVIYHNRDYIIDRVNYRFTSNSVYKRRSH